MRVSLCLLLAAACVLAVKDDRRTKLPYVADAVGNTLPPPSNVPATVGSPVNLLTPDRYEFYTFDESGELVKRLMTLEEIQAIVAAGEENEGLVTFANDNQPTIAFNFSQPPHTKVHSVVTNVQNVLKAQIEAHKNKPQIHPTLDTPDVSDSWSLILPSIFGNTGVDIVPDKTSASFTTPETETIELDHSNSETEDNSLSKEGDNQIFSSSTTQVDDEFEKVSATEKIVSAIEEVKTSPTTSTTTTTTTTTLKPITMTTVTVKPSTTSTTTTMRPTTTTTTTTTTRKPTTTTTTTSRPTTITTTTTKRPTTTTTTTTTKKPTTTTTTTTTRKPTTTTTTTTTRKPTTTTTTTTTKKPTTTITTTTTTTSKPKIITTTPEMTTLKHSFEEQINKENDFIKVSSTEKNEVQYEKISTFIPVSTVAYVTQRTTMKHTEASESPVIFVSTTRKPAATKLTPTSVKVQPAITTYKPSLSTSAFISSTIKDQEFEKLNATTITTQSVSPSTTVSSTEFMSVENPHLTESKPLINKDEDLNENESTIPLFDVAQSISQIASDLGGNYPPIPTTSNILDTSKINSADLESKENLEIEIPADVKNVTDVKSTNVTDKHVISVVNTNTDNFVKLSTLTPHNEVENNTTIEKESNQNIEIKVTTEVFPTIASTKTTIDPILSEIMDDLMFEIVNQPPQSIINSENISKEENVIITTEKIMGTTTDESFSDLETTTEILNTEYETSQKSEEFTTESAIIKNENLDKNLPSSNEKNVSELPVSDKIKYNSTNEPTKTENNIENYVKISILTNKNESIFTSDTIGIDKLESEIPKVQPPHTHEDSSFSDMNNQNETVENSNENDSSQKITISSTSTTTPNASKMTEKHQLQSVLNKIESAEHNKLNTNEKVKIPEYPKVDEFKKKIQKVNIDDKELANERNNSWKLISTVSPPKDNEIPKDKNKADGHYVPDSYDNKGIVLDFSKENQGLEVTTKDLEDDIAQFTELCNELAFRYWNTMIENIDMKRSFIFSPYSITSMLAMMFMGARGATSGEMNEILKLDDMVTFNPHFTLKNISDSIETTPESGVIVSAFIKELYSDRNKGKILTFYKERAQHFYNGHVEEINFKLISDVIRRRTNLLVKRYTWGRIVEYMKSNSISMEPPLAAFSTNIFQTDCSGSSVEGRDGEMYFVVSPNVRQRRLVPVPAVVYKKGFLAGYDPVLDATAAALGNTNSIISTLFLMPGQQGNVVHAEDLEILEKKLLDANPSTPTWNRLLRTLLPRIGLELQIPRFSHTSIFNVSSTLRKMGLKDLFDPEHADLGGLNGPSKDLYLSDMVQSTTFVTCGEGVIGEQHHIEEYPETLELSRRRRTSRWASGWDEPRDYQRAFHDPHDVGDAMHLPLHLRPRQARLPARSAQPARLKFDRPFLYFVRHNPSGMILYVGRYNPRLLP